MIYRTIVTDDNFDNALKKIRKDFKRTEEAYRGIEWILSRNPNKGKRLSPDSSVWIISITEGISDLPPCTIYYTFDNVEVCLLYIELPNEEA